MTLHTSASELTEDEKLEIKHEDVYIQEKVSINDVKSESLDTIESKPNVAIDSNDITFEDVKNLFSFGEYTPEEYEALPCFTIRLFVIALILSAIIKSIDIFFSMRFPAITIKPVVAQMVSYPMGKIWAYSMPNWNIKLFGKLIPLNPGKFNKKEHTFIYVFINTAISTGLLFKLLVEQKVYFKLDVSVGRTILFSLSTFLWSWGLSGLLMPVLVFPKTMLWPSMLGPVALFETLHSSKTDIQVPNWTISRYRFLIYVFFFSFVLYWLSDLIIPFITYIGAFISWCKPNSAVLGQVFGTENGLALIPLTFSWPQISSLSNPLLTPFWVVSNIYGSFVFWILIILPALYYSNFKQTAHLPMLSNGIFNTNGTKYDASKVVNKAYKLDMAKYKKYSPVMLPIGLIFNLALGIGGFAAVMVTFFYRFKSDVIKPLSMNKHNTHFDDKVYTLGRLHWGLYVFAICLAISFAFVFFYAWDDQLLSGGGYVVSCIISMVVLIPLAMIEGKSNIVLSIQSFMDLIGSHWFTGRPTAVMYFYLSGYPSIQHVMNMQQSLKLCMYTRTDLKKAMILILIASIWGSCLYASVTYWFLDHIKGICTTDSKDHLTCKAIKTKFNTDLIWGLFGDHIFGQGGRYNIVLWFFLIGVAVAVFTIVMQRMRPNSEFWKRFNPALFFGGAQQVPTSTGINYHSWFIVAFIFNYFIHKYKNLWWRKYNLVLAVAMECGVAIAAILVYFAVVYTGGSDHYNWWGTTVASSSCDSNACPYKSASTIKKPAGIW